MSKRKKPVELPHFPLSNTKIIVVPLNAAITKLVKAGDSFTLTMAWREIPIDGDDKPSGTNTPSPGSA